MGSLVCFFTVVGVCYLIYERSTIYNFISNTAGKRVGDYIRKLFDITEESAKNGAELVETTKKLTAIVLEHNRILTGLLQGEKLIHTTLDVLKQQQRASWQQH